MPLLIMNKNLKKNFGRFDGRTSRKLGYSGSDISTNNQILPLKKKGRNEVSKAGCRMRVLFGYENNIISDT